MKDLIFKIIDYLQISKDQKSELSSMLAAGNVKIKNLPNGIASFTDLIVMTDTMTTYNLSLQQIYDLFSPSFINSVIFQNIYNNSVSGSGPIISYNSGLPIEIVLPDNLTNRFTLKNDKNGVDGNLLSQDLYSGKNNLGVYKDYLLDTLKYKINSVDANIESVTREVKLSEDGVMTLYEEWDSNAKEITSYRKRRQLDSELILEKSTATDNIFCFVNSSPSILDQYLAQFRSEAKSSAGQDRINKFLQLRVIDETNANFSQRLVMTCFTNNIEEVMFRYDGLDRSTTIINPSTLSLEQIITQTDISNFVVDMQGAYDGGNVITQSSGLPFTLTSSSNAIVPEFLRSQSDTAASLTMIAKDIYRGKNSVDSDIDYLTLDVITQGITAGSEHSKIEWWAYAAGTKRLIMRFDGSDATPGGKMLINCATSLGSRNLDGVANFTQNAGTSIFNDSSTAAGKLQVKTGTEPNAFIVDYVANTADFNVPVNINSNNITNIGVLNQETGTSTFNNSESGIGNFIIKTISQANAFNVNYSANTGNFNIPINMNSNNITNIGNISSGNPSLSFVSGSNVSNVAIQNQFFWRIDNLIIVFFRYNFDASSLAGNTRWTVPFSPNFSNNFQATGNGVIYRIVGVTIGQGVCIAPVSMTSSDDIIISHTVSVAPTTDYTNAVTMCYSIS